MQTKVGRGNVRAVSYREWWFLCFHMFFIFSRMNKTEKATCEHFHRSTKIQTARRPSTSAELDIRKTDSIYTTNHPEGVVYRSFCFNSSTVAVSEVVSRRWWCIESLFPIGHGAIAFCALPDRILNHVVLNLEVHDHQPWSFMLVY